MGISLSYRRISEGRLHFLYTAQDEDLVTECMYEDDPPPFDSPASVEESEHLDLDKLYPLIIGFLNPTNDPSSIFRLVTHGGKSVIDDPMYETNDYLGVVYFLTPQQVRTVTQAMNDIPQHKWAERYRILMDDETIEEARLRSEFPTYDDVIDLFADVCLFFQQATDNSQAILRWYT